METKEKNQTTKRTRSAAAQSTTGQRSRQAASTRTSAQSGTATRRRSAATAQAAKAAPEKRTSAASQTARKRKSTQQTQAAAPSPDVVYTPAKPFNRNRFLLRLLTVAAVVIALVFGISLFFKVDTVTVSGAEKYSPWMVMEASGIREGENLLTVDKVRASGKIIASLPYVESVRIAIQLPDTVHIEITEMDVVYSIKDTDDAWWLINSDGKVVLKTDSATAGEHTKILGIQLQSPEAGGQAQAAQIVVDYVINNGTGEIQAPQTTSGEPRLSAALSILQYLENNSMIGSIASVDVSDIADIQLWYGQQYQVKLGDTTELGYKISAMKAAIEKLEDYQQGILDVTFTTYPDQVVYKAFD